MQRFFSLLFDQLFPKKCLKCHTDGQVICNNCLQQLDFQPHWQEIEGVRVWSAYEYSEPSLSADLVKQWKYHGDKLLIKKCIQSDFILPSLDIDCILPVPLHRRRLSERGFNQAEILAIFFSDFYKVPINIGLKRLRYTSQQAKLSKVARQENVKGAFGYTGDTLAHKTVLLVDDVLTTGATLLACQTALLTAGAKQVIGMCLFRG